MSFPILSFAQNNPVLAGQQMGNDTAHQALMNYADSIKNRFLAPSLAEQLSQAQSQSRIQSATAKLAPQMSIAALLQAQALPNKTIQDTALEHAQTGYYSADTQQKLLEAQKSKQMLGMMNDAYYGPDQNVNNTLNKALTGPQTFGPEEIQKIKTIFPQQDNISRPGQPPAFGSLSDKMSVAPNQFTQSPDQQGSTLQGQLSQPQGQSQQPQEQLIPGVNVPPRVQRLMKLGDVLAAGSGKTGPTQEFIEKTSLPNLQQQAKTQNAYVQNLSTGQAKNMNDMALTYSKQQEQAQSNNQQIAELGKATDEADIKGRWADLAPSIAKWDPGYSEAMKNQMQLQMGQIKGLAGTGLGRILDREVEMIAHGTPSINLPPEALKVLSQQMKLANDTLMKKAELFNKYKGMIQDPASLNTALNSVVRDNNPVDDKGNLHPERVEGMDKYATPQLMQAEADPYGYAAKNGIDTNNSDAVNGFINNIRDNAHKNAYPLPKGISEDDLTYTMNKKGMSRSKVLELLASKGIK